MSDRKLHTKTVYILAWVILVCAGILIMTGIADDVWKLVYRGIYGSSSGDAGGSIYSPGAAEPDVYCYMDYWESGQGGVRGGQDIPDGGCGFRRRGIIAGGDFRDFCACQH